MISESYMRAFSFDIKSAYLAEHALYAATSYSVEAGSKLLTPQTTDERERLLSELLEAAEELLDAIHGPLNQLAPRLEALRKSVEKVRGEEAK